jgi:hypothetical protein
MQRTVALMDSSRVAPPTSTMGPQVPATVPGHLGGRSNVRRCELEVMHADDDRVERWGTTPRFGGECGHRSGVTSIVAPAHHFSFRPVHSAHMSARESA